MQYLKQAGLTDNEISIYLCLLESGQLSAAKLADATGLQRTNVYKVVDQLIAKQLLIVQGNTRTKQFLAKDPLTILDILEKQKKHISFAMPELRQLFLSVGQAPKMALYEGIKDVEKLWNDALQADQILCCGSLKQLIQHNPSFFRQWCEKSFQKKIMVNMHVTNDSLGETEKWCCDILKGYLSLFCLPSVHTLPAFIMVWQNNIIITKIEKPLFTIVVRDESLVDMVRILFAVMNNKV
jgi:sugar-specific transcriptional regulator TrmB